MKTFFPFYSLTSAASTALNGESCCAIPQNPVPHVLLPNGGTVEAHTVRTTLLGTDTYKVWHPLRATTGLPKVSLEDLQEDLSKG